VKVKFIGATPEEDKIVEIPEGVTEVTIPSPWSVQKETADSMWPIASVLITIIVCFTFAIWMFTR
jgi:hypothetical protein